MARYTITADLSVAIELSVEAGSESEAREMFDDHIAANVTLIGQAPHDFDVIEDSIGEVTNLEIFED